MEININICLVLGCDISMQVKDDGPDPWNAKTGNVRILMFKSGMDGQQRLIGRKPGAPPLFRVPFWNT